MNKIQAAVSMICQIADNNKDGYAWGGWGPDYDCGHLIIDVWQRIGVPVKSAGASYTGNMRPAFMSCGFADVTATVNLNTGAQLQTGDVLLNQKSHAAMVVGSGKIVQARSDLDGEPGDSSGQEIREQSYYNYPWDCVLRYKDDGGNAPAELIQKIGSSKTYSLALPLLRIGDKGETVRALQMLLIARGYNCGGYGADGDFGSGTGNSVRDYQSYQGLSVDGEVGGETWGSLLGVG